MLEADGWKTGADGVRVKAGRRLDFELLTVCDDGAKLKAADLIRQRWVAVGAAVRVDCRRRGVFLATFPDGGTNSTGAFDMSLFGNTWLPDPSAWEPVAAQGQIPSPAVPGGLNWNRCRDAALERSFAQGDSSLRLEDRRAAYLAAQREWLSYHCTIPLYEVTVPRQVSGRVRNFVPTPLLGGDSWNAADWFLA
jgi:peptide/nickel transport system substrate-binding protein